MSPTSVHFTAMKCSLGCCGDNKLCSPVTKHLLKQGDNFINLSLDKSHLVLMLPFSKGKRFRTKMSLQMFRSEIKKTSHRRRRWRQKSLVCARLKAAAVGLTSSHANGHSSNMGSILVNGICDLEIKFCNRGITGQHFKSRIPPLLNMSLIFLKTETL